MNIETTAKRAYNILKKHNVWSGIAGQHGMEIARGFFVLHNDRAGQSRVVLYHPFTDLVYKFNFETFIATTASGRHIGTIELDGKTYRIRLPRFESFVFDDYEVYAMEYVRGRDCCPDTRGWCDHANQMVDASGCNDAHAGNYKIVGDEIVLFDFEGIVL